MFTRLPRQNRRYSAALVAALVISLLAIPTVSGAGQPEDPGAQGLAEAIAAQEIHTPDLLAVPGVVGTAVGLGGGAAPVIKVYTSDRSTPGIPQFVDGFPVVVETVGAIFAQPDECSGPPWQRPPSCSGGVDPTARFDRPVPIGVSTGHPAITAGTIGARVTDGTSLYALSNNHVYANENLATVGDNVLQPGTFDGGTYPNDAIGTLHAYIPIVFGGNTANRVDAAIAKAQPGDLGDSTPADGYGTPASEPVAAVIGAQVIKYGRTTNQTTGKVDAINAIVNVTYDSGTALFTGQVIIRGQGGSFSAGGDSGSLIVTADGHNPVALLFAGNSSITVGNPIGEVLTALGVYFEGGSAAATTTTTSTTSTTTSTTTTTTTTTQPPGDVVIEGINPATVASGATLENAAIAGSGFTDGSTVTFSGGSGPTPKAANAVASVDGTLITLDVVTKSGGPPRDRTWDLTVTNPDGTSGTASDALTVTP